VAQTPQQLPLPFKLVQQLLRPHFAANQEEKEQQMKVDTLKAVVTGGASGMGREFTLSLAREGADVVFCDLNEEAMAAVEAEAKDFSGSVTGVRANVASEADVLALFDKATELMGGVNCLINNAGIFRDNLLVKKDRNTGEIKTMPLADWDAVIAVDLTGPFLCTREMASRIAADSSGPGVVINISSIARHGNRGQTNYSAAKAGLIADTRLWGVELARFGIRVAAIAPGFVNTPILQGMPPQVLEKLLKAVPLNRAAETAEVYQAAKFIIECDYFTGRCIDLDGGLSL
jgi:3-oxoacyl-[acyl-carrier protein] reductase